MENDWIPETDDYILEFTQHKFPEGVTAALGPLPDGIYIFFKGRHYCIRKLDVDKDFQVKCLHIEERFH